MVVIKDLSQIDEAMDGQTVSAIKGKLQAVYDVKKGTGRNNRPYHLQNAKIVDERGNSLKLCFDHHGDMKHYKDREVFIVSGEGKSGSLYVKYDEQYGVSVNVGKDATVTEDPDFGRGGTSSGASSAPAGNAKEYWVCEPSGEPYAASANEIQAMVDAGKEFDCCKDGASEWSTPASLGFRKTPPPPAKPATPPPTQSAPPQQSAPPSQSQPATGSEKPRLPDGVQLKEISYHETRQVKQFEPVKIELTAAIQTPEQIVPTYEYLQRAVRYLIEKS